MPEKRRATEEEDRTAVTSLRVPKSLSKRARVYAAQNDLTLQDVATLALEEYLKKRSAS